MSFLKEHFVRTHKSLALVGMMGVGKTTIGEILAAALALPFYEVDEDIARTEGMSIPDIFKTHGESYCRAREYEAIERLSANAGILSLGGGAFVQDKTRLCEEKSGYNLAERRCAACL